MKKIRVIFSTLLVLIMMMPGLPASASTSSWETVGSEGFSGNYANYESIAFCGGIPYVAYNDADNGGVVKKFNGTNWEDVGGPFSNYNSADDISLAFYDNKPYVAYKDGANSGKVSVKKYDGESWVYVGSAGFSVTYTSCINLAFSGSTPYVAYIDGSSAAVKYLNGTSWASVGTLPTNNAAWLSFAINGGMPYIAYQEKNNSSKATVKKFDTGTGVWSRVGTADLTAGAASYISITFIGNTLYMAFADGANSNKLSVMKYNGSWSNVTQGFSYETASYISLASDGVTPYIAYTDLNNGYLKKYNGTSWDTVGETYFAENTMDNSLALNDGTPYVAYNDVGGFATVKRFQTYYYGSITVKGTPGAVYQIKQGSTVVKEDTISASGSFTKSNIPVGNYSVVEKTPPSGCFANKPQEADITSDGQTVSVTFVSYPLVTITASKSDVSVNGGNDGQIQVTASGGTGTYEYSIGADWQSGNTFSGLAGGIYQVKARDKAVPENVSDAASVEIKQPGIDGTCLLSKLPSKVWKNKAYQIALPAGYTDPVFTTSNSNIATVTGSGIVKFINKGSVKITMKAMYKGKQCTVSKTVTVSIPVETITISYTGLSITKGKLAANITPIDASNKKVTWTSSNSKIASVSKTGIITAKSLGTVTITAKAQDGSGVVAVFTVNIVSCIQH